MSNNKNFDLSEMKIEYNAKPFLNVDATFISYLNKRNKNVIGDVIHMSVKYEADKILRMKLEEQLKNTN